MITYRDVERRRLIFCLAPQRKCLQYWPDEDQQQKYGAITVTLLETSTHYQYVIRKLVAKKVGL